LLSPQFFDVKFAYLSAGIWWKSGRFVWFSNDGLCRMNPGGLQNWSPAIAQDHHRSVVFVGFENCIE